MANGIDWAHFEQMAEETWERTIVPQQSGKRPIPARERAAFISLKAGEYRMDQGLKDVQESLSAMAERLSSIEKVLVDQNEPPGRGPRIKQGALYTAAVAMGATVATILEAMNHTFSG